MGLKIKMNERLGRLYAFLDGEIDHHSVTALRTDIDLNVTLYKPKSLFLDFSAVTFMDSSGIGLVMGRYKKMNEIKGRVFIQNPPNHIKRVMLLSGVNKLAKIVNADMIAGEVETLEESSK
ncbi:MAG: anti-sigma factor antagonist [Ruminococcus sp.]|nr:anti-sigma factor antagonist [Ruminococcus sp.]